MDRQGLYSRDAKQEAPIEHASTLTVADAAVALAGFTGVVAADRRFTHHVGLYRTGAYAPSGIIFNGISGVSPLSIRAVSTA